jgi:hypothetical protein
VTQPLFQGVRLQEQYEQAVACLVPGERVRYADLLQRMKAAGYDTAGVGVTLEMLKFRGSQYTGLWRRSEIVTYSQPFFDYDHEGTWTDGAMWIVRRDEDRDV